MGTSLPAYYRSDACLGGSAMTRPRRTFLQLAVSAAGMAAIPRVAMSQVPDAVAILCPTGKLRAALILSNPVLVTRRSDGALGGVSVAVAHSFAAHLGVPLELKPYDNPTRYNESL